MRTHTKSSLLLSSFFSFDNFERSFSVSCLLLQKVCWLFFQYFLNLPPIFAKGPGRPRGYSGGPKSHPSRKPDFDEEHVVYYPSSGTMKVFFLFLFLFFFPFHIFLTLSFSTAELSRHDATRKWWSYGPL